MRNSFSKYITIIILFFSALTLVTKAEKRALVVAIGNYPTQSGWPFINSENDVPIIVTALKKQGFKQQNIAILKNEQATKQGIANALNRLINSSQAGDIVVFHFSGHGQQVTDISGDEFDGLDEALVPYDAPKTNKNGASKPNAHLIDDELNLFLTKLRAKVGTKGDVLVFIDACHSGTATRSANNEVFAENFRGTNEIFIIPGYEKLNDNALLQPKPEIYLEEISNTRSGTSLLSPIAIISACAAEQLNKEYKNEKGIYFGSLSFAISKVLSNNITQMSYVSFFESVSMELKNLINANSSLSKPHFQTPQMEGNAERKVFAGKTIDLPRYFKVTKTGADGRVVINAGTLNGIFTGAEIAFYPADTYNRTKATPIAIAKVDSTTLFESALTIDKNINRKQIINAWAFVTKYRYKTSEGENADEMRARVLRNAKSVNSKVDFQLIPLDNAGKHQDIKSKTINGNIEFKYGDRFVISVSNNSSKAMYFQLIDVMPDNAIALATDGNKKYDYIIKPGESKIFSKDVFLIDTGSALGLETLVLIASEKQMDLRAIESKSPQQKRTDTNEFENWLNEIYSNERTTPIFDSNKINIATKSFIVKEK